MLGEDLLRFNLEKSPIVCFDLETESLNLAHAKPWQVSWTVNLNNKEVESHNYYLKWPDLNVSEGAAIQTGFDPRVIEEQGKDPKEVIDLFEKYLYNTENLILGANILGYDVMILNHCRKRLGLPTDYSYLNRCYDTNALSKAYKLGLKIKIDNNFLAWQFKMLNTKVKGLRTNVGAMCKEFNIFFNEEDRHDALVDVRLTYQVFRKLILMMDIC